MIINFFIVRHGESFSNMNRDLFYPQNINLYNKIIQLLDSINYEPILTTNGIKQSKILKEKFKNNNFDLIICSNLIRSIMTGIFAFDSSKEIIICPFINETQNFLGVIDKSNKPNNINILKKKIEYLKCWFLKKNISVPNINLEYYNNFDNNPDFEKFIKLLKDIIKKRNINKKEINICIISHGNFIRKEIYKFFNGKILEKKLYNTETIVFSNKII
jgi:broad specificity phosphatase PhoE